MYILPLGSNTLIDGDTITFNYEYVEVGGLDRHWSLLEPDDDADDADDEDDTPPLQQPPRTLERRTTVQDDDDSDWGGSLPSFLRRSKLK